MKRINNATMHGIAPENLSKALELAQEPFNLALSQKQATALRCNWDGCESLLTKKSPFGPRCADHFPKIAS